jgi:hypothetical protein
MRSHHAARLRSPVESKCKGKDCIEAGTVGVQRCLSAEGTARPWLRPCILSETMHVNVVAARQRGRRARRREQILKARDGQISQQEVAPRDQYL